MRKHLKQKPEEPKRAKLKKLSRMTPLKRPASVGVPHAKRLKLPKVLLRKPASPEKAVEPSSAKQNVPSPLRQRRHGTWKQELRGLDLKHVPISALSAGAVEAKGSEISGVGRPKRFRCQVLNAWRNERIVYERLEGSPSPSVVALRLNCAPRPVNVVPRSIDGEASAAPRIPLPAPQADLMPLMDVEPPPQQARAKPSEPIGSAGQSKVAMSANRLEVKSTFMTLPSAILGRLPQRVALPAGAEGVLHVISGSVRLSVAESGRKAAHLKGCVLHAGDTAKLPGAAGQVLVAATGADRDPARVFYALVKPGSILRK